MSRAGRGASAGGTGPPTVNDVAELAGVSRQTVSNVLNAPQRVRPATLARVRVAIERLDYRPDHAARSLKAGRTRLIGYRVPPDHPAAPNSVMDGFLHALAEAARAKGYHVLLFTPGEEQDEVDIHGEMIARHAADGFVVSGVDYDDPRIPYLTGRGVPFVAFGRSAYAAPYPWVDVDGAAGAEAAVAYLAARGHRRIAHLGWVEGSLSGAHRALGYRRGLGAAGLPYRPELELRVATQDGAAAAERLLGAPEPPTAIVAASDVLALLVLEAARARGLRVGAAADLAVIGFDDIPVAPYASPPLTTMRQPLTQVAQHVVRLLLDRVAGGPIPHQGVLVPPELVPRESG